MKIFCKFFRNNKNIDFTTKFYLYLDYKRNLKFLNKKYKLEWWDRFLFFNVNFSDITKTKNPQLTNDKNLPDLQKELTEIKSNIIKKRIAYIKMKVIKCLSYLNVKYLVDLKNSQNNIKQLFDFLSKHIATYKKSIQELVEGQREVTQNKNFTFDDGETVQKKIDKFENNLKEHMNLKTNFDNLKNK